MEAGLAHGRRGGRLRSSHYIWCRDACLTLSLLVSLLLPGRSLPAAAAESGPASPLPAADGAASPEQLDAAAVAAFRLGTAAGWRQAITLWQALLQRLGPEADPSRLGLIHTLMGNAHSLLGEKPRAGERYRRALELHRAAGDRPGEAVVLSNLGQLASELGEMEQALELLEQSRSLHRQLQNRAGEATSLNNMAVVLEGMGERRRALALHRRVLAIRQQSADAAGEALSWNNIGAILDDLGDGAAARSAYGRSLELRRQRGDPLGEATVLSNLALLEKRLGRLAEAQALLERALVIQRQAGAPEGLAVSLANLAALHDDLGQPAQARALLEDSLAIRRRIGDRRGEAVLLSNLGLLQLQQGRPRQARSSFERALAIARDTAHPAAEAAALINRASLEETVGEFQAALESLRAAVAILRRIGDPLGEAVVSGNLGAVYESVGEGEQAELQLRRALAAYRELDSPSGIAVSRNNLGSLLNRRGRPEQALVPLRAAEAMHRASGDRDGLARALNNIGAAHVLAGRPEPARRAYRQALAIKRQLGDRRGEAVTLNNLGNLEAVGSTPRRGLEPLDAALALQRGVDDAEGMATTLLNRGRLHRRLGDHQAALSDLAESVRLIDGLRSRLADDDLRASFLASAHEHIDALIDLLMELHRLEPGAGHALRAYAVQEQSRARGLRDGLARQGDRPGREQRQRRRAIERELRALGPPSEVSAARRQALMDADLVLQQELHGLAGAAVPVPGSPVPSLEQARRLIERLRRELLQEGDVLLQYNLGPERSTLWVVDRDGLAVHALPPGPEISEQVQALRRSLLGLPDAALLSRLHALLIGPADLPADTRRLILVPDGALQVLPFAALEDPASGEPLLARFSLAHLPSVQAVLDRPASAPPDAGGDGRLPMLIVADPDLGAGRPHGELRAGPSRRNCSLAWQPLPGTGRELEAIAQVVSEADRVVARGAEATAARLLALDPARFPVLHFATHACVNARRPDFSGIVLAAERSPAGVADPAVDFLYLQEILDLELDSELVVLSACDTALGRQLEGEGPLSLSRAFMLAGARTVLSSLWSVDDRSTAALMAAFYRHWIDAGLPLDAALRQAQLELMRTPRWRAPYHWAAFHLHGRWR
ncbi:CHAT domain-containing protein [Synechococcus sp. RSCCF101]|uniref:CHAT domain-containing tetratricopeptide repeat protein n=1 Tax=Synechococcus sp. RSCCF101 TaxID=2511069 RepID=UPI0012475969|nr:CHAT domain-containing tetratricopeptide repeat protein [Synechococcus sp. RSCCF101]QEY31504.1 CHAT domain-containing protein [Synechococcus sp. RSCCF101]